MQPAFALSVLALLVARVSGSAPVSLFARQSSSGLGLSDIPDACQTTCGPIETTINSCQDLSCLCNNSVAAEIADCANCLVAVGGSSSSSLQSQEQSIIDQYTSACDTSGEPISSIQVSSVAPSSAASGSGSGSGSASATTTASGSGSGSTATSPSTSTANSAAAASSSSSVASSGARVHSGTGAVVAILAGVVALLVSA